MDIQKEPTGDKQQEKSSTKKKIDQQDQKELEKFSKELVKRISTVNKMQTKRRGKGIFGKVNPLVLLVSIFLTFFLFFGLFSSANREGDDGVLNLGDLVAGIESNRFSQIVIKDDGDIIAKENPYLLASDVSESSALYEKQEDVTFFTDVSELSLSELFELKSDRSLVDEIRAFFGRKTQGLEKIVIGENYAIGIETGEKDQAYVVFDVTADELYQYVEDNDISLESDGIEVVDLQVFGKGVTEDSLLSRKDTEQIETVIVIDDVTIAVLKEDYVRSYTVDWTPSIYSFADSLIQQGISLNQNNVEIITEKVPGSIGLNDILTVLTIVVFIVLAFIIFKSAQASGMGIMQFGQSKARMFFGQKTDTSFKDVAGIDEAREELNEIVDFLKSPGKYRKLGARIPKGILMFGQPGTGKTLLARAIAGEAGVPFFHTSGSEFEEMLVGAGASRVRDLFAKAKKAAPALIFIDEIDAVARRRGTRIQSGSTEQTLNQILVEMDGFEKNTNVIVLAATNRPDVLDPAILRPGRFDRQVRIELPDKDGRLAILKIHGRNKPFAADVDLERIAKRTVGFSGADLENILNEAAIIAAKAGQKDITNNDIDESVSKVVLGPAKKSRKRSEEELKLVAYHEAGHALVAKMTPNATPVDKISIVSRGGTGGVTMFLPEKDESIVSKGKLLADIVVTLGGRAAEELVLDDISTGASNDITQATQTARQMIQKFGMSEELGLVQYGDSLDSKHLGYAYGDSKDYSEKTAELIDDEVRKLVGDSYTTAKGVITKNKAMLDKIANLLLEKEVVDKEEFEALFKENAK